MTGKVKRAIEVARARVAPSCGTCVVCRGRVSRYDTTIRMHAGPVHTRCAGYRSRRR